MNRQINVDLSGVMKVWTKWLIALLCVVAAGLSLWLSIEKWSGRIDTLAGCGAGSGCSNVLGSRWSLVFGVIPISIFSFALYVGVLLSLGIQSGWAERFRGLAAWLCLLAALWFTALQIWVIHSLCPYCMSMHGVGVLLALALLFGQRRRVGFLAENSRPMMVAFVLVALLAAVQYWGPGPETHRVDELTVIAASDQGRSRELDIHGQGEGRLVLFLKGAKSYRVDELPHLGAVDAEHVVVEYFDYTCDACREMHAYLERAVAEHPEKLVVVVLPVPLEKSCNPHLPQGLSDHENACELARLSLKVWRAEPSLFPEFHRNLFDFHGMPLEAAEALAAGLVGEERMSEKHEVWVDAVLRQNVEDYHRLIQKTPVMPKLLLKDSVVVQGLVKDMQALDELLETHLEIK